MAPIICYVCDPTERNRKSPFPIPSSTLYTRKNIVDCRVLYRDRTGGTSGIDGFQSDVRSGRRRRWETVV